MTINRGDLSHPPIQVGNINNTELRPLILVFFLGALKTFIHGCNTVFQVQPSLVDLLHSLREAILIPQRISRRHTHSPQPTYR